MGNEPEQCCSLRRARGFSGMLFAYGCTVLYIILGEKGVCQPGFHPDPAHGDGAGDIPNPKELRVLVW